PQLLQSLQSLSYFRVFRASASSEAPILQNL
ncbi:hypothetical protein A2U01_0107414, partial [Trifolium medium]|nr:hypothetical protein [Trifolium medium]